MSMTNVDNVFRKARGCQRDGWDKLSFHSILGLPFLYFDEIEYSFQSQENHPERYTYYLVHGKASSESEPSLFYFIRDDAGGSDGFVSEVGQSSLCAFLHSAAARFAGDCTFHSVIYNSLNFKSLIAITDSNGKKRSIRCDCDREPEICDWCEGVEFLRAQLAGTIVSSSSSMVDKFGVVEYPLDQYIGEICTYASEEEELEA